MYCDPTLELTAEQLRAVMSGDKRTLVLAGPGSGKTTVVVERVLFLVRAGVDPATIAVMTFTIAAAKELVDRLATAGVAVGFAGTLHAFCLKFLRDCVPGMADPRVGP
jgi:DNA helicase-2/ATP-dependent DNA helicase PcrA